MIDASHCHGTAWNQCFQSIGLTLNHCHWVSHLHDAHNERTPLDQMSWSDIKNGSIHEEVFPVRRVSYLQSMFACRACMTLMCIVRIGLSQGVSMLYCAPRLDTMLAVRWRECLSRASKNNDEWVMVHDNQKMEWTHLCHSWDAFFRPLFLVFWDDCCAPEHWTILTKWLLNGLPLSTFPRGTLLILEDIPLGKRLLCAVQIDHCFVAFADCCPTQCPHQ